MMPLAQAQADVFNENISIPNATEDMIEILGTRPWRLIYSIIKISNVNLTVKIFLRVLLVIRRPTERIVIHDER